VVSSRQIFQQKVTGLFISQKRTAYPTHAILLHLINLTIFGEERNAEALNCTVFFNLPLLRRVQIFSSAL